MRESTRLVLLVNQVFGSTEEIADMPIMIADSPGTTDSGLSVYNTCTVYAVGL